MCSNVRTYVRTSGRFTFALCPWATHEIGNCVFHPSNITCVSTVWYVNLMPSAQWCSRTPPANTRRLFSLTTSVLFINLTYIALGYDNVFMLVEYVFWSTTYVFDRFHSHLMNDWMLCVSYRFNVLHQIWLLWNLSKHQ